ncbi:MAG TPA: ATP synthase F0 subunit B [Terriglobia bacterium]|nr:ATP synthase F0 subunit B [Terriglobia bacterium]
MSRALRGSLLAMLLLGALHVFRAPVLAAAPPAEQAEEGTTTHEMLFEALDFALLVAFLIYLYRKRGKGFFNQRTETIRKSLEEGRQALERSQARLAEAEQKLTGLQSEVRALKDQAEAEIAREQERMRQAAEGEARRIEEFAKARILAATNSAKLELKDYVVKQALEQARGRIQQRLDEESRKKLVELFLADLSSKANRN